MIRKNILRIVDNIPDYTVTLYKKVIYIIYIYFMIIIPGNNQKTGYPQRTWFPL